MTLRGCLGEAPERGLGLALGARVREAVSPHTHLRALGLAALLVGCAADANDAHGHGDLAVRIEAEETITDGLQPGTGNENIVDGWSVHFEKYVASLGDVELGEDERHVTVRSAKRLTLDLRTLSQGGMPFEVLSDIDAKPYAFFGYSLVAAGETERDPSVAEADFAAMVNAKASYLIEGFIEKSDGESCPPSGACRPLSHVDFRFLVPVHVKFGPCELEAVPQPGVAVTSEGTSQVGITLHGDHMFFDAFPTGEEIVQRRAQWLADADADGNGSVDYAELAGIRGAALSAVFPSAEYSLGTWTATLLETAADVVRSQLSTQGHYQGEGECLWTLVP